MCFLSYDMVTFLFIYVSLEQTQYTHYINLPEHVRIVFSNSQFDKVQSDINHIFLAILPLIHFASNPVNLHQKMVNHLLHEFQVFV